MSEEFQSLKGLIDTAFDTIKVGDVENANSIMSIWSKVLLRIQSRVNPNEGRNLSEHTRVSDLKNGLLIVEADHPGWISLLQMHKNYILRGLQMELPELKINNIAYKLKGKKDDIYSADRSELEKKTREEVQKQIEQEEKQLEAEGLGSKNQPEVKKNRELPPELAAMFDEMKESVLTNSKK